ncbi:MAG TPA: YidB family protein [Acidisphaera sp.]|nr:YidB family protein [Acidisphaera sp.]HME27331.1 YidB family protein [Acetobacteraceae bacterium]
MSPFDEVAGSLLGQGAESAIAGHLRQVIEQQVGIAGLVQRFELSGAGGVIGSWVGVGLNAPIAPEQLQSILGSNMVQQLAQRTGLPIQQLMPLIAQHLPGVVDRATLDGQVSGPCSCAAATSSGR